LHTATSTTSLAGFTAGHLAAALLHFATTRSGGNFTTTRGWCSGLAATSRSGFAAGSWLTTGSWLAASWLAALRTTITEQTGFGIRYSKARHNHDQGGQRNQNILHNNPSSWENLGHRGENDPAVDATNLFVTVNLFLSPLPRRLAAAGKTKVFYLAATLLSKHSCSASKAIARPICPGFAIAQLLHRY
jgi:hypothetical protein